MPELPEVETVARGIAQHIVDQHITQVEVRDGRLRWPVDIDLDHRMTGQRFISVSRRGKYLLLYTQSGCLIIHLGMSGALYLTSATAPLKKHDHILFTLRSGQVLRYHDPRRFGSMHWTTHPPLEHPLLASLGPEPLSTDFDGSYLHSIARQKRRAIKVFIMDAHVVVGVGNIYASEALFLAQIHPETPASHLDLAACSRLVDAIRLLLKRSIAQGGTTLRDFVNIDSKPGYFKQSLAVYGRQGEPCHTCQTPIVNIKLGQRATCFCPQCQPVISAI